MRDSIIIVGKRRLDAHNILEFHGIGSLKSKIKFLFSICSIENGAGRNKTSLHRLKEKSVFSEKCKSDLCAPISV